MFSDFVAEMSLFFSFLFFLTKQKRKEKRKRKKKHLTFSVRFPQIQPQNGRMTEYMDGSWMKREAMKEKWQ